MIRYAIAASIFAVLLAQGGRSWPQAPAAEPVPAPPALVRGIKVLPDKAPDCTTLKTIVDTVTRGCRTNDERAIAIYNFMRLTHYHRAYPEPNGISVLKEINCYGWSLCGGLHAEQSALWRELGWKWRFVGWPGHTTAECFYDGRWHYLDVFLKFYAWMPDANAPGGRTIAGEDDLAARPQELMLDAFQFDEARQVYYARGNAFDLRGNRANWQAPAFLVCGDDLPGMIAALKQRTPAGAAEGWGGVNHASDGYTAEVHLAPGWSLTNTWDKREGAWYWPGQAIAPCHTCGDKEIRNSPEKGPIVEPYLSRDWKCESYANGQLQFRAELSNPDVLDAFAAVENARLAGGELVPADPARPARVTLRLQSPYIMTQATGVATGSERFELSFDGGRSWRAADLRDFGPSVAGQLQALARFTIPRRLTALSLDVTVQNNPFALPFLSPGRNVVSVSTANPAALGKNRLVVTYAYRTGARRASYEQLYLAGKEIARGHDAAWETTPTVVQRTFTAGDLPAVMTIDIPTPPGQYPVYPRMLFVRREILAPGQEPLPLPEGGQPPVADPAWELKTLPNPLLAGAQAPPPPDTRPTRTVKVPLRGSHFVSAQREVLTTPFLTWPKNADEQVAAIAYLIGGELSPLPDPNDLAAARLIVPVVRGHARAPAKLGVAPLRSGFGRDKPYDLSLAGDVQATAVVPTLADDAANWNPPRAVQFDVTRRLRAVLGGAAKFHGFALRVVPDRAIDDGWTVRVHLPREPQIVLELEVYEKRGSE